MEIYYSGAVKGGNEYHKAFMASHKTAGQLFESRNNANLVITRIREKERVLREKPTN